MIDLNSCKPCIGVRIINDKWAVIRVPVTDNVTVKGGKLLVYGYMFNYWYVPL